MSTRFTDAAGIPVNASVPITAYSPVVLDMPGRPVPLALKVTMPALGEKLPIILLSHGHGASNFLASYEGYGPVANFWAAHGFAVIQPTHLNAMGLGLRDSGLPDAPTFWHARVLDMRYIVDHIDEVEAAVPGLAVRKLDHDRIGAVGHSLGGSTVGLLLGMRVLDPKDDRPKDLSDPRVKAGVIIAAPGINDGHLGPFAQRFAMLQHIDYDAMKGAALVIAGDKDLNPNFSQRLSYRWDAFTHSPGGNKALLTFRGAGHIFGGISGYDSVETDDESPERVAALRAMVWAYLRSQLYVDDPAWKNAVAALESMTPPPAMLEIR
jgi:dienelactone hydrolase